MKIAFEVVPYNARVIVDARGPHFESSYQQNLQLT